MKGNILLLKVSYIGFNDNQASILMYAKSDDHELVKIGNPNSQPQYTQSAEVGYKAN